jgi:L-fuculose-phosphate aldolase
VSDAVQPEFQHAADIPRARQLLVEVCARMHARGYIVAGDGNVSVRIGEHRMLVTPSGARKGFMKASEMVICDLEGRPVPGEARRPSSEIEMHVAVYAERPDVNAVVHAHPPCAIAHTIAKVSLGAPLMPEAYCALGEVVTIPYTTPTTHQVPAALRAPIRCAVALIMERHGSITVGTTLDQAYDRLEILEHTARISMFSRLLAPGQRISGLDERQLEELKAFLGCGLGC